MSKNKKKLKGPTVSPKPQKMIQQSKDVEPYKRSCRSKAIFILSTVGYIVLFAAWITEHNFKDEAAELVRQEEFNNNAIISIAHARDANEELCLTAEINYKLRKDDTSINKLVDAYSNYCFTVLNLNNAIVEVISDTRLDFINDANCDSCEKYYQYSPSDESEVKDRLSRYIKNKAVDSLRKSFEALHAYDTLGFVNMRNCLGTIFHQVNSHSTKISAIFFWIYIFGSALLAVSYFLNHLTAFGVKINEETNIDSK